jgi:predicted amidohydrolase YtcJ
MERRSRVKRQRKATSTKSMRAYHGSIISCDDNNSVYSYLVEKEGRIIYVGDELPAYCGRGTEKIELGEKALLPAFGDGHIHYSNWAHFNSTFDVRKAASIEEVGVMIKRYANKDPRAKVLFGFGHSIHSVREKRLITRTELDAAVKDRPIYLVCFEGHSAVVNTAGIGIMPPKIRALPGFDLETGRLTREAFQEATDYISGRVSILQLLKAIVRGLDTLADYGVGLVHTVEGIGFPRDLDVDMIRFLTRGAQQQFRVYFQTMDVDKILKRNLPRVGGCFACALDGSFNSSDAALLEPYCDDPENRGVLFYSDRDVKKFVSRANREGLQIQLHCIGDAAVIQAVEAIEAALKETPRLDHRHTLIHACLIPEHLFEKIAALGIHVTVQPGFIASPLEPAEHMSNLIGYERAARIFQFRSMLNSGINVNGSSDGPVLIPKPVEGIYGLCNHDNPSESVTIAEALRIFTLNVARTSFDDQERGSLEVGKVADMVVLNRNPLEMQPADLLELKVEQLYIAGRPYEKGRSLLRTAFESLMNRSRKV